MEGPPERAALRVGAALARRCGSTPAARSALCPIAYDRVMAGAVRSRARWFCIAGLWRETAEVGEAFTMLTMAPGPDIAPYHDRQVVILDRKAWAGWLDPSVPARSLIRPLPPGSLAAEQVG